VLRAESLPTGPSQVHLTLALGAAMASAMLRRPVWSVTCFFVARGWRGKGLMSRLLAAAAEHARKQGAPALEGYPIDSKAEQGAAFVYPGVFSTFVRAGFTEVARKARTRPVVRLELGKRRATR